MGLAISYKVLVSYLELCFPKSGGWRSNPSKRVQGAGKGFDPPELAAAHGFYPSEPAWAHV